MEHTVQIDFEDGAERVGEELRDFIRQHDELRIEEPDAAMGVVEVGTIIITISAAYDLTTSLIRDVDSLLSDSEAITAIENVEKTAKGYIEEHTSVEAEELYLHNRTSDGSDIELVFVDEQNREHQIRMNRYDSNLEQINYVSN